MTERSFFYRYCIVIPEQYQSLSDYFLKLLSDNDFDVQKFFSEDKNKRNIFLCLSQKNEEKLLREAQNLKIKKVYNGPDKIEHDKDLGLPKEVIEYEKLKPFVYAQRNDFLPDKAYDEFYDLIGQKKESKSERWGLDLFTESEMLHIEKSILENIPVPDTENIENEFCKLLKENNITLPPHLLDSSSIFQTLINLNVITDYFPLHVSNFPEKIIKKTLFNFRVPYRLIRSYFNDHVSLYFAWTYHYTRLLVIPAFLSIFLFIFMKLFPQGTKNFLTLYAILICVWTQFFSVYWNRKTSELKIEWDNYSDTYDKENLRKEFKGEYKKSLVTGKYEKFYSNRQRLVQYFFSFIFSQTILSLSFMVNVAFLNLKGDIGNRKDSFLYIHSLNKFSNKGSIFEVGSTANQIVGIVQVLLLTVLNLLNGKVSIITTNLENHKVKSTYENSLILKRFVFEFLNCFFSLYYLAFVAQDLKATKSMISGILYFNEVKRIIAQTVLPNIMKTIASKNMYAILISNTNPERLINGKTIDLKEVIKQQSDSTYNTFDDYLELMLEFCYLTLFAECIPVAAILLIIVNTIEIKSDLLKLGTIVKRPEYLRKRNIGSWHIIINAVGIMAIFTNLLFTYTFSTTHLHADKFNSLLSFCIWEHIVFGLIILLRVSLSGTTGWVRLFMERRDYRAKNEKWKGVMNVLKSGLKK